MTSSLAERTAPVLETARLRLRPHHAGDHDDCFRMWSDPDVTRFIGGRPQTREEAWARVLRYAGMWALVGKGFWVVERKDDGAFLGEVGVMEARRDMEPPLGDDPEIGWAFLPAAQGQGFASEAVDRAIRWAEQAFPLAPLTCIISPDNAPSLRVAAKFGFVERLRTVYHGEPTIQFQRRPQHPGRTT